MSCLTLNPTSVNNHNAQYAHKHAISTQRGVTTGETQREKNNGENDANCEMSFCEKPPCPKICFAKIWFPQGCVCENPGYPGPWFAKDQGQIFLKRFAIVKLFVATCAHILINEENIIFLRNVGFEFHSLSSLFFMNSLRKNNMSRILFCENPASQRMCLRKSWGIRTLVCERSGSGLSQKMFHVCMSY